MKYQTATICSLGALLIAGCNQAPQQEPVRIPVEINTPAIPDRVTVIPQAIPGGVKSDSHAANGGYAASSVQAKLNIDIKEGTDAVTFIRDNTDPFVITKPYIIRNADPYAVRSYLEAAVGARSVNTSPAQVMAVKYNDGTGVVLVSAEEYRFKDSKDGRGIDNIVAALDRKGLSYLPEADAHVYFPRINRASGLRDMLLKVGSSELDPEFAVAPSKIMVDGEINALIVKAPIWDWNEMLTMLRKYDQPAPEVRISYRVLEIYSENDDRIGVDFQSWKNNDGVDLFSAGTVVRRNWGTFFTSGLQNTDSNRTSYWNFNPKWNTRYLDLMTSIGKAKCLAEGTITAANRKTSQVQVNSGFFYDRTFYKDGATSLADGTKEFVYTEPNPDTIVRESPTKILSEDKLKKIYKDMGVNAYIAPAGYTRRVMGTQTTTFTYFDAIAKAMGVDSLTSPISKYLTGYVNADGVATPAAYYNTNWNAANAHPGIIHGWLQYPMVVDGFQFNMVVTPVITGRATQVKFDLSSISLLGWNADGSARRSLSKSSTTVQIGRDAQDFVIGGLRKSESVRSTAGLPFLKDIPVLGRALSTESESIKQSQLVLVAHVEYTTPDDEMAPSIREDLGKVVDRVNKGMNSKIGNMFFQQFWLDDDRAAWHDRLDQLSNEINDSYQTEK